MGKESWLKACSKEHPKAGHAVSGGVHMEVDALKAKSQTAIWPGCTSKDLPARSGRLCPV